MKRHSRLPLVLTLFFSSSLWVLNGEANEALPAAGKVGNDKVSSKRGNSYIKASSGILIGIDRDKEGCSMTTPDKISISVNPLGRTLRGRQSINRIESKVRFQAAESDYLYYTLANTSSSKLFHLVLIEKETNPSKLCLGYYKENEDHIVDPVPTPVSILVRYVIGKLDKSEYSTNSAAINSATNSTTMPSYAAQPSVYPAANETSYNTTRLQGEESGPEFKPFKPLLTLDKGQEYSIEVAWKSTGTITSVSMPDSASMTSTTVTPSPSPTLSAVSSVSVNTTRMVPVPPAAMPVNVGTQIIVRKKSGQSLTTLNLDLDIDYYSFSSASGKLLEYEINDSELRQLSVTFTDTESEDNRPPSGVDGRSESERNPLKVITVAVVGVVVLTSAIIALLRK